MGERLERFRYDEILKESSPERMTPGLIGGLYPQKTADEFRIMEVELGTSDNPFAEIAVVWGQKKYQKAGL